MDTERPTGVPDDAVPMTVWLGREGKPEWDDYGREASWCVIFLPDGTDYDSWDADDLRKAGVPVPPYQPAPDPEALLVEKITADWTAPDPADSPTGLVATPLTYTPPVAGERTGPLGLSEGDPLMWNDSPVTFIKDDRGSRLIECESEERVWVDPASTFVVEWDAQPEPGETHADIAAELRLRADAEETPPHASPYEASKLRNLADRIEAASRPDPDPDTITVNLPATNLADLVRFVERDGRSLNASVLWTLRHFQTALADRLAAAGLPQEPTEGGQS